MIYKIRINRGVQKHALDIILLHKLYFSASGKQTKRAKEESRGKEQNWKRTDEI